MTNEEILKIANNFQGANREFSQEMPRLVEALLDKIDEGSVKEVQITDVITEGTYTVQDFLDLQGIDEQTLSDIVNGKYSVIADASQERQTCVGQKIEEREIDGELYQFAIAYFSYGQGSVASIAYNHTLDIVEVKDIQEITGEGVAKVVVLTESAYSELATKVSTTEYIIVPD